MVGVEHPSNDGYCTTHHHVYRAHPPKDGYCTTHHYHIVIYFLSYYYETFAVHGAGRRQQNANDDRPRKQLPYRTAAFSVTHHRHTYGVGMIRHQRKNVPGRGYR